MKSNVSSLSRAKNSRSESENAISVMMLAAFTLLTTEFIIVGLLPSLARDMGITISAAGQLVTLFAFTVMLGGPFLTALLSHLERKKLFIGILLVFCISNALCALATNYWMLSIARILAALALPVFWGTASETAAQMATPGHESKAVSRVYLGVTAALVFGISLGTLVGNIVGWRGSFWLISALCLIAAVLMTNYMPGFHPEKRNERKDKQTSILKDSVFIYHIMLSLVIYTAMFTAYTYLADLLESLAGIPASMTGWWLMGFGVVGMIGNHYAGQLLKFGAIRVTFFLLIALSAGTVLSYSFASSKIILIFALSLWAMSYTALYPVCQIRVMQAGVKAQALAGSMNVSAANGGIALGSFIGGIIIKSCGLPQLGWVSIIFAVLAVLICFIISRQGCHEI